MGILKFVRAHSRGVSNLERPLATVSPPPAPAASSFDARSTQAMHSTPNAWERAVGSPTALSALVVLAILLRVWDYAGNPGLWLDEILLARNIIELSLADLVTKPLVLDQVAPRGFLLVEKLIITALGPNELALRLFPFLTGIAGVFIFRRLSERALDGLAVPTAMLLFAICVPHILHGVEVKQYEGDATATILLLYLALRLRDPNVSRRRLVLTGLAAFGVIWFSQASVIVMGGIGAAFAAHWLVTRDRASARALFVTIPMWALASGVAVLVGLRSMTPSTREFMDDFWSPGFAPRPLGIVTTLKWFWTQSLALFTDPAMLRYRWPTLFLVLALLGVIALWRARRDTALFVVAPVGMAFVAAVAHQYPYSRRLAFYLIPVVLVAISAGIELVRRQAGRASPVLGAVVAVALLFSPVSAMATALPPYEIEHHREVWAYLQRHRQPGDVISVFPLSRVGALQYAPRYGFTSADWTTTICDRGNSRPYLRELDRYRGRRRVWLVSSGTRAYEVPRVAVRRYLNTIGVKRDSLSLSSLTYGDVTVELFDLSDSTRLAAANAETFPAPPIRGPVRPGCRPWILPSPTDSLWSH